MWRQLYRELVVKRRVTLCRELVVKRRATACRELVVKRRATACRELVVEYKWPKVRSKSEDADISQFVCRLHLPASNWAPEK